MVDVFEINYIITGYCDPAFRNNCFRILAGDEEEALLIGDCFLHHHGSRPDAVIKSARKHKDSEDLQSSCGDRRNHAAMAYCMYCGHLSPWYGQYGIGYNPNFLKQKRQREAVSQ